MRNRALKTAGIGVVGLMFAVSGIAFAQEFIDGGDLGLAFKGNLAAAGGDVDQNNSRIFSGPIDVKFAIVYGGEGGNVASSDMSNITSDNVLTVNGGVIPADGMDPAAEAAGLDQDVLFEGGSVTNLIGIQAVVAITGQSNSVLVSQDTVVGQVNVGASP